MLAPQVRAELDRHQITYEVITHPAVYTATEADQYMQGHQFAKTKNLFLHDKTNYFLVVLLEDKRLSMKELRLILGCGRLSFANTEQLKMKLGVIPGAVSPLNLLNNKEHDISLVMDRNILETHQIIGCHPNDNRQTVILSLGALLDLVKAWGNQVQIVKL